MAISNDTLEELLKEKGIKHALAEGLKSASLDIRQGASDGFAIARQRTRVIDFITRHFFSQLAERQPEHQDFIFAAYGGYGRQELAPNSDIDLILIADRMTPTISDYVTAFTREFPKLSPMVSGGILVNTLSDIPQFEREKTAGLLDIRLLNGNPSFYDRVREHLKQYTDPLEFILGLRGELEKQQRKYKSGIFDARSFNIKYGIGGLRHFHIGLWTEAIADFIPSVELYQRVPKDVLDAVGFLIRLRTWLNLRKDARPVIANNDNLLFDDIKAFAQQYGQQEAGRIITSRKIIRQFADTVIYRRLRRGIQIYPGIEYGVGGLKIKGDEGLQGKENLFYRVMLPAQRQGFPIDADTYHSFLGEAATFIKTNPAFLDFFFERGSLATTLKNMSRFNVLGTMLPGFSNLESALYEPGHRNSHITRAGQAIRRIENLENLDNHINGADAQSAFFEQEYRGIEREHLAALRLALLCKGIPKTIGISVNGYLSQLQEHYPQLPSSVKDAMAFLLQNQGILFDFAQSHVIDDSKSVEAIARQIGNPELLRDMLIFTYADLGFGKQRKFTPLQWQNIIDLYSNTMSNLIGNKHMDYDPLKLDEPRRVIAASLPESFMRSRYSSELVTYVNFIMRAIERESAQIRLNRTYSDNMALLEIASEDFPGLLWRIAGTCYKHGIDIAQAQIYSLSEPKKLALDFFGLALRNETDIENFKKDLALIMSSRGDLELPDLDITQIIRQADVKLEHLPETGYVRMTMTGADQLGLLYAVTRTLSEKIGADIHATNAYTTREGRIRNIILFKSDKRPEDLTSEMARYFSVKAA